MTIRELLEEIKKLEKKINVDKLMDLEIIGSADRDSDPDNLWLHDIELYEGKEVLFNFN